MSDGTPLTLESLRVGTGNLFACFRCGIPKPRSEFGDSESSIACHTCAPLLIPREATEEDLRKKRFDSTIDRLRDSQDPAIPGGVQKAHEILGGKTSTELIAEFLVEIKTGQTVDKSGSSFLPRDGKLYARGMEMLQRAEIRHDEFLRDRPPVGNISYEEAQAISIDTFINEMTRDRALRNRVLGILYNQCPDLISELMDAAGIAVLPGGVI